MKNICLRLSKDNEQFAVITDGKERTCYSFSYQEHFENKCDKWLRESKPLKCDKNKHLINHLKQIGYDVSNYKLVDKLVKVSI